MAENTELILKGLDELKAQAEKGNEATKQKFAEFENQVRQVVEEGSNVKASVEQINEQLRELKAQYSAPKTKSEKKAFGDAFAEAVEENFDQLQKVKKGSPVKLNIKAVGNMTLGNNLTGDSVATYGQRQATLPATRTNFRDLIPTVQSDTGLYVFYRESAGEGSISVQTEGSPKTQIDFDFSEVKVVNDYIAGFARVSKQAMRSLPFLQGTLPRLLMREFYNTENSTFYTAVSGAATGSTTTAETNDVKQIIDYIANQRQAKYNASYGLVSYTQLARLNKLTFDAGYYAGSGGVVTAPDGTMTISGVPIIPVDWVADDKIMIVDRDFLERVEVEGLTVEFFEQDSDNVQRNLITARIECYEDINLMLTPSALFADLGNVA
jgi:HK97 family phage major capsid protein